MVETLKINKNVRVRIIRVPIGARTVRHAFTILFIRLSTYVRRRQDARMCRDVIYLMSQSKCRPTFYSLLFYLRVSQQMDLLSGNDLNLAYPLSVSISLFLVLALDFFNKLFASNWSESSAN